MRTLSHISHVFPQPLRCGFSLAGCLPASPQRLPRKVPSPVGGEPVCPQTSQSGGVAKEVGPIYTRWSWNRRAMKMQVLTLIPGSWVHGVVWLLPWVSKAQWGIMEEVSSAMNQVISGENSNSNPPLALLGKQTDWNRLPWPGTIVTICMSCFTTGGPSKEQGTNKPPPTRRVRERSKGDTTCLTTSQNASLWHPSWLNKACTTRKDSESEWLTKDNLETNPITIKPKTASHVTELFSWVPLPNKISCFVSTCVSLDNSFPSVRQEPSFGPWKGSPFLQQHHVPPTGGEITAISFHKYNRLALPSGKTPSRSWHLSCKVTRGHKTCRHSAVPDPSRFTWGVTTLPSTCPSLFF